jgi:hypothetical protein
MCWFFIFDICTQTNIIIVLIVEHISIKFVTWRWLLDDKRAADSVTNFQQDGRRRWQSTPFFQGWLSSFVKSDQGNDDPSSSFVFLRGEIFDPLSQKSTTISSHFFFPPAKPQTIPSKADAAGLVLLVVVQRAVS